MSARAARQERARPGAAVGAVVVALLLASNSAVADGLRPLATILEPGCACLAYETGVLDLRQTAWFTPGPGEEAGSPWAVGRSRDACHLVMGQGPEVVVWDCRAGEVVSRATVPSGADGVFWGTPGDEATLFVHTAREGWRSLSSRRERLAGAPGITPDRRHAVVARCPPSPARCELELTGLHRSASVRVPIGDTLAQLRLLERRCRGRRAVVWQTSPAGRLLVATARVRDTSCGGTLCATTIVDLRATPPAAVHESGACAVAEWHDARSLTLRGFDGSGFDRVRIVLELPDVPAPSERATPVRVATRGRAGAWELTLAPTGAAEPALVVHAPAAGGAVLRDSKTGRTLSLGPAAVSGTASGSDRAVVVQTLTRLFAP